MIDWRKEAGRMPAQVRMGMTIRSKVLALDHGFRMRQPRLYCGTCGDRLPRAFRDYRRNCDTCATWALSTFRRLDRMMSRRALSDLVHGPEADSILTPDMKAVMARCSESARARHRRASGWTGPGYDEL